MNPSLLPSAYGAPAEPTRAAHVGYQAPNASLPIGGSRVSSNAYASGANQNAGNVLVDGRPTTRLHAPPGGRTSIVLG